MLYKLLFTKKYDIYLTDDRRAGVRVNAPTDSTMMRLGPPIAFRVNSVRPMRVPI